MNDNLVDPALPSESGLHVVTLGGFQLWIDGQEIQAGAWGRDKALQLFQFLVAGHPQSFHKEQIIDRLWPLSDPDTGARDFKVALNAVTRALEPDRAPRTESRFIRRMGPGYGLTGDQVWVDAPAFEAAVSKGNQALDTDPQAAARLYEQALALYRGDFLPERRYDDWTSARRERLQTLMLGTVVKLADLQVTRAPLESIRLAERALEVDRAWEDAYRTLMRAYLQTGNRPLALRTYKRCVAVLQEDFQIPPLPETQALHEQIRGAGDGRTPA